jgi:hypothetical protein
VDIRDELIEVAREVNRLSGIDRHFDGLIDGVLARLRGALGAPDPSAHDADPVVEAEFRAARERLVRFRSEFEDTHARILVRYVGGDQIARAAAVLADDATGAFLKAFLRAQVPIASDGARAAQDMAKRMSDALMFEEPEP